MKQFTRLKLTLLRWQKEIFVNLLRDENEEGFVRP